MKSLNRNEFLGSEKYNDYVVQAEMMIHRSLVPYDSDIEDVAYRIWLGARYGLQEALRSADKEGKEQNTP